MQRLVLLCLAVLAVTAAGAQTTTTTIDAQNPLVEQTTINEFERSETVTRNLSQVDMEVTVAEDGTDAGLTGPRIDSMQTYLRLDYDEGISRTIRIYVPSEYFEPRVQRSLSAANGGPDAQLTPTANGTMTAVTIEVSGPTDSPYAISAVAGDVWAVRSWARDKTENTTGWEFPTLAGGEQWQYIDAGTYSTSAPARINGTAATIQYQAGTANDTAWLPVPECDDPSSQAVCSLEERNATIIMSSQDSPRVRYKYGTDPLSDLGSAVNDLRQVDDRIEEFVGGIFGGA